MEPKSELLVFNRKEIVVIIVLFVLVAFFSFTLGVRLGKTLGVAQPAHQETVPLVEKKDSQGPLLPAGTSHQEEAGDEASSSSGVGEVDAHKPPVPSAYEAENKADKEFVAESAKAKIGIARPVPMTLPKEKKGEGLDAIRYTLQVGSHRTVAEAAEQVTGLKRSNLDAFYLEAKVPGKGTWYRVGIGLFANKEIAEKTAAKWKESASLPPYIVQKINE